MAKKMVETNPFVQALEIKGIWKLDFKHKTHSSGDGGAITYAQSRIRESDDRVALYTDGLLGWFCDLSKSAKDMFMYICVALGYEKDVIELSEELYCERMKVSRATFYNAKTELTNRLIIPRTSRRNTYWINPAYLFKGSRIEKYPDRVVQMNENPLSRAAGNDSGEGQKAVSDLIDSIPG